MPKLIVKDSKVPVNYVESHGEGKKLFKGFFTFK